MYSNIRLITCITCFDNIPNCQKHITHATVLNSDILFFQPKFRRYYLKETSYVNRAPCNTFICASVISHI